MAWLMLSLAALPAGAGTLRVEDIPVVYDAAGQGKTALVFVHGWACDSWFWHEQIPAFRGGYRTLAIDLPGYGRSGKPRVEYTPDLFARAIRGVLDAEGVTSAVLIGHSMGTHVARHFYRLYPEYVRAVVSADGVWFTLPGDEKEARNTLQSLQGFVRRFEPPAFREEAERFIRGMIRPGTEPALARQILSRMLETPEHVALSTLRHEFERRYLAPDPIRVPVYVLAAAPAHWSERALRRFLPDLDFEEWSGVGHFLMLERPREFNAKVAAFLRRRGL